MESVPLFPLPGFVLFPRTHAPLHIFEPRYRAMIETVIAGDRRLGIVQLRPGYEHNYHGTPRVYRTLTIARVLVEEKAANGRWNILVEGIERAEIDEEIQARPFRVARVRHIVDEIDDGSHAELQREAAECARIAESIAKRLAPKARSLHNMMNSLQHPGIIADVAANLLVPDPYSRQSILEAANVRRRLKLLMIQLSHVNSRILAGDVELPVAES